MSRLNHRRVLSVPRRFLFSPLGLCLQMPDRDDSVLPGWTLLGHCRPASWGCVLGMSGHHTFLPSCRLSSGLETQFQRWGEGLSAVFS